MSRYDGLIIPRSYSEYINKTDAATLSQALQLSGVMDAAPTENSNKAAKSGGIYNAIDAVKPVDTVELNNMNSVTSNAVANEINHKIKTGVTTKSYRHIGLYDDLAFNIFNGLLLVSTENSDKYCLLHIRFRYNQYNDVTVISNKDLTIGDKNNFGTIVIGGMSQTLTENHILALPAYERTT